MNSKRKLAAIMFTDIVGYTALMGDDEEKAFDFLRKNRLLHKPVIEHYGGRWIKELGDGVMASFDTVSDAVYAAIQIQEACRSANEYCLRIGIHQGEVVFEDEDVFGDAVNIAARIQALAPIGGIWISESVQNNVSNKTGIDTRFAKTEMLKNVKEPVRIYEVVPNSAKDTRAIPTPEGPEKSSIDRKIPAVKKETLYISIGAAILLLILFGFLYLPNTTSENSLALSYPEESIDKSIAVLPFVNMSSDKDQEYFSDGLSEELLNHLAKIHDLKVIARTSSFAFKGKNEDIRAISEKLGVAHILEGSVRKDGNKIRVTAQLIRASDGVHLWSQTFERDMEGVFKLQDEIAAAVVEQLKLKLLPSEVASVSESNIEVYNLILKGNYFFNKMDEESVAKALDLYLQALALDSLNADIWAKVAGTYSRQAWQNYIKQEVGYEEARKAALKAITLDANSADGYQVLGGVKMYRDFDWKGAEEMLQMAHHLQAGNSLTYYVRGSLASTLGRYNEAIEFTRQSLLLDPLRPISYMNQGNHYTHSGNIEEGMVYFRKTLELDPNFQRVHMYLGRNYLLKGQAEMALLEMRQEPIENFRSFGLALAYHALGHKKEAEAELQQFITNYQKNWPYLIAQLYAYRGEKDKAFEWLEKAYKEKDSWLTWYKGDPLLKNLRSDPRYTVLMKKLNLPLS